ncbi:hypothetical protein AD998_09075 [bacterium 336/3]|nr:hypothetical protein AD998_09075 [bacterium 336/3]
MQNLIANFMLIFFDENFESDKHCYKLTSLNFIRQYFISENNIFLIFFKESIIITYIFIKYNTLYGQYENQMTRRTLIFNPIFLIGLLILLLNDFYLKQTYSNELTGKLSDFVGLIVFPVFMAYLIPSSKKWICIVTGILFIIWKTPIVTPLIDTFNLILPFKIQRIIDYSDYWALLILPISHIIIQLDTEKDIKPNFALRVSKLSIAMISLFAICATSRMPVYRTDMPEGTIYIGESYKVKKSKEETIQMIKSLGYNVDYYENPNDSVAIKANPFHPRRYPYYQTDNITIYDDNKKPIDTILNVKYSLYEWNKNKTMINVINVTLKNNKNIQSWRTLKYLKKQYKAILEKNMIEKMK